MTKISPEERCACGGTLVPPEVTALLMKPPGVDYVCLKCGAVYAWKGKPPALVRVALPEQTA
jgi:hypothetical protein